MPKVELEDRHQQSCEGVTQAVADSGAKPSPGELGRIEAPTEEGQQSGEEHEVDHGLGAEVTQEKWCRDCDRDHTDIEELQVARDQWLESVPAEPRPLLDVHVEEVGEGVRDTDRNHRSEGHQDEVDPNAEGIRNGPRDVHGKRRQLDDGGVDDNPRAKH